jgi:putative transposase
MQSPEMIDREHELPVTEQAEILICSGCVYYQPRPVCSADIEIMQRLDRLAGGAPGRHS